MPLVEYSSYQLERQYKTVKNFSSSEFHVEKGLTNWNLSELYPKSDTRTMYSVSSVCSHRE